MIWSRVRVVNQGYHPSNLTFNFHLVHLYVVVIWSVSFVLASSLRTIVSLYYWLTPRLCLAYVSYLCIRTDYSTRDFIYNEEAGMQWRKQATVSMQLTVWKRPKWMELTNGHAIVTACETIARSAKKTSDDIAKYRQLRNSREMHSLCPFHAGNAVMTLNAAWRGL